MPDQTLVAGFRIARLVVVVVVVVLLLLLELLMKELCLLYESNNTFG